MHIRPQRCVLETLLWSAEWKGKVEESFLSPEFFLPHIVVEASSGFSNITGQGNKQYLAPINEIVVIIVVSSGAFDNSVVS